MTKNNDQKNTKRGRPKKNPTTESISEKYRLIRLSLGLFARLQRIAEQNYRPTKWEAEEAILAHIEKEEKKLQLQPITQNEINKILNS